MSCDVRNGIMILVGIDYKAFGTEIAAQQREDYDARTLFLPCPSRRVGNAEKASTQWIPIRRTKPQPFHAARSFCLPVQQASQRL